MIAQDDGRIREMGKPTSLAPPQPSRAAPTTPVGLGPLDREQVAR
jgi:hypothetical protein